MEECSGLVYTSKGYGFTLVSSNPNDAAAATGAADFAIAGPHSAIASTCAKIVSLDVECVAGSAHHCDLEQYPHSRIPATVCIVDVDGKVLLDEVIAIPECAIFSYLTPLTGLTKESFDRAKPKKEVLRKVHSICTPTTTIGPLKMDMAGAHSARNDSIAGVRLYRLWVGANEKERAQFLNILESTKHPPSVVKTHQFKIDGVCMTSKFKFCSCNRK
eukprot:gene7460-10917_t